MKLERFQADGLKPVVAVELEFYLIDREAGDSGAPRPPRSPVTGERESSTQVYGMAELDGYSDFLDEVDRLCAIQNVPADTAVAEYAWAEKLGTKDRPNDVMGYIRTKMYDPQYESYV